MGKPRLPDVEKQEMLDLPMLLLTLLLTVLGLVMIYSSSFARALYESGDSAYYFKRQAIFALVGTGAMLAISRVRPELIRKMAFPVLGASILFLILVFVPGIGRSENGATRWVSLGISFQPSEVAKLGVILSFAAMIARFGEKMETFRWGIAPFAGILAVIVVLLRLEPHNSAIVIIACTAGAMLFLGGVKYRWFILGGCAMLLGLILILGAGGYEASRITAWQDPFSDPTDDGYQIIQSLYAIGSGGLFGLGFGQGRQKYLYLPEEHNDYIFSIACEELGLIGAGNSAALCAADSPGLLDFHAHPGPVFVPDCGWHYHPDGAPGVFQHRRGDESAALHRNFPPVFQLRRHGAADSAGGDGYYFGGFPAMLGGVPVLRQRRFMRYCLGCFQKACLQVHDKRGI